MKAELVPTVAIPEAERVERVDDRPAIGSWWWLRASEDIDDDDKQKLDRPGFWFVCVVDVGSNYVKLSGRHYAWRIALDDLHAKCEPEGDPRGVIDSKIGRHRDEVRKLMGKIQKICAQLGVPMNQALAAPVEASTALAVAHGVADVKKYKNALVKAKEKTLPELFAKVKQEHELMASWMRAELTPFEADLAKAKGITEVIKQKIHTVELYAGLTEELVQVREGDAAPASTKVHLIQRRAYMDEECLARYEAGGMDFEDVEAFDKWLGRDENMIRLLPFERSVLAFRIRHHDKDYGGGDSLSSFIKFQFHNAHNKQTFLYIRNGHQLWRMTTTINFDSELFPNREDSEILGEDELWVKANGVDASEFISGRWRLGMIQVWKSARRALAAELWAWKRAGKPEGRWIMPGATDVSWWTGSSSEGRIVGGRRGRPSDHISDSWKRYKLVTPENIYYDDAIKHVAQTAFAHNRVAVVIQGLLDRSTCLHPHPPWRIWTAEGFAAGIELIYDVSRAITPGEAPSWEGYFAQNQKSVRVGAYVRGHRPRWVSEMEDRYGSKEWRWQCGNGPSTIARVEAIRGGKACFKFTRPRRRAVVSWVPADRKGYIRKQRDYSDIDVTWWCPITDLFCVDAYTPGDFHIFFDDPRTRSAYVKWAPFLLSAEDWHYARRNAPPAEDEEAADEGRDQSIADLAEEDSESSDDDDEDS